MYDLLIKGGRVIDPANSINDVFDIGIKGKRIVKVDKSIPESEGRKVVNASQKIVTPGLIDIHCHVYHGVLEFCVEPDIAGVLQGVTTVADGGSSGQAIFGGFPKYVIPSSKTTVFCFLHLGSLGLSIMPEIRDWSEIDINATFDTIGANKDIIKGIKLRLVGKLISTDGVKVIKTAKKIAKEFNLPLMIHIGDTEKKVPPKLTQNTLELMEKGDILSHIFTANFGGIYHPDGIVLPELRDAMDRGIVLDVANGAISFSYDVARKCMDQGIYPTTLSTDLHKMTVGGPVYGLTVTMSKFLALGVELEKVIKMTTINPARVLNIENQKGSITPGMDADISILELKSGRWKLYDSLQKSLDVNTLISPVMVIKCGEKINAQPFAKPKMIK